MRLRAVIVAPDGDGSLAGYARALVAAAEAPAVTVGGCSGGFGHSLLGAYARRRLADDLQTVRALRRLRAPLLHFTSHHLARYGPLVGTPYVVTVHDLMRHRDWRERGTREPLIHEPNLSDRLHLRMDAWGLRCARLLIAVSEHTRRELTELLGIPREAVHLVPEGVDRSRFRPVDARPLEAPYLLYVGSEQPRKNLGTLFEAFMRVRERTGMCDLRLVKVGAPGGPEAPFRERTLARARAAGALPHLVFAGRVGPDELTALYSGALCLVQPSRHEGFGLPPLEAMACGCPAVVSAGGALPEVVGDAGVVYGRPDDVAALAAALERIIEAPEERAGVVAAGLDRAAELSWQRTAALTRRAWREALADRAPVRGRSFAGWAAAARARSSAAP